MKTLLTKKALVFVLVFCLFFEGCAVSNSSVSASASPAQSPSDEGASCGLPAEPTALPDSLLAFCFVAPGTQGEWIYYKDEASFLQDFLPDDAAPIFEYRDPDGALRLRLYYNAATRQFAGLRYKVGEAAQPARLPDGFVFEEVSYEEWGGWEIDYTAVPPCDAGVGIPADVLDYQEHYEQDSAGRVTLFSSQGVLTVLGDTTERSFLLSAQFLYSENGLLLQRLYHHNIAEFSSSGAYRNSFFDPMGRLIYEDIYLTHGSLDQYYFYQKNENVPVGCLQLDCNGGVWVPKLICYQ